MPYDRSAIINSDIVGGMAFDYMLSLDSFVAEKFFTAKVVPNSTFKVPQYDTSKLRLYDTKKSTNSEADLIDENIFTRELKLEEHKLGAEINPRDLRDAANSALIAEARKAKIITLALMLAREKIAADLATTSSNYPSTLTSAISAGSRFNEAGGDPEAFKLTVVDPAMRVSCGQSANAMLIDVSTYEKMVTSPDLKERIKYTSSEPIGDAELKKYFHVQHLFVGKAMRDSAQEGATPSVAGFWGDNALFYYYNPSVALEDVSSAHMYLINSGFTSSVTPDPKRTGVAGPMRRVQLATEYKLASGYVVSSSDSDFAAAYLARTVVT